MILAIIIIFFIVWLFVRMSNDAENREWEERLAAEQQRKNEQFKPIKAKYSDLVLDFIKTNGSESKDRELEAAYEFYAGDVDKIANEINLQLECAFEMMEHKSIVRSETTVDSFRYPNMIVNFIAMAAVFSDKDITLTQFIDSTHGNYEYVSKGTDKGVNIETIRAYGRTVKFYDGHSQQSALYTQIPDGNESEDGTHINEGYVYALINPSMEGLVKIGKTTKDPKERAKELSSATGVATPFIVAYYRKFKDCSKTEKAIHNYFETIGVRRNNSREFFEVETHEAVKIISEFPDDSDNEIQIEDEVTLKYISTDNIDLSMDAEDLFQLGVKYQKDKDLDIALSYYKAAANKSHIKADRAIGLILLNELDSDLDSVSYFIEGVKKDNVLCYGDLGLAYYKLDNFSLANDLWDKFFENLKEAVTLDPSGVELIIYKYIGACLIWDIPISEQRNEYLKIFKESVIRISTDNNVDDKLGVVKYIESI